AARVDRGGTRRRGRARGPGAWCGGAGRGTGAWSCGRAAGSDDEHERGRDGEWPEPPEVPLHGSPPPPMSIQSRCWTTLVDRTTSVLPEGPRRRDRGSGHAVPTAPRVLTAGQ